VEVIRQLGAEAKPAPCSIGSLLRARVFPRGGRGLGLIVPVEFHGPDPRLITSGWVTIWVRAQHRCAHSRK
jgi:hypothetical protein